MTTNPASTVAAAASTTPAAASTTVAPGAANGANTPAVAAGAQAQPFAAASLYVGDLNPDVSETQLFEIFKAIGPVASIRVCRDAITRRSLGYAYVNYHNPADARTALDSLNYKEIRGRPCRIMFSQRDPSLRKQGTGNIFIKNLDPSVDNKALYDTFSAFGTILSCKVASDDNGSNRGYAFVHYETEEAATKAIETVNGKLLAGRKCFVARFVPAKERNKDLARSPKWTNVFVKNLPKTITEQRLVELFGKSGKVTSAVLRLKRNELKGGDEKAFGFVNFATHEEAAKAVDDFNGKEIDGSEIYVGRAQKKGEREKELRQMFEKLRRERMSKYQGVNLFVKNLEETVDDEKLRQEFTPYGTITSAKVMRDDKGTSKGFGFVCFASPDEATKAVTEMNNKMLLNKPLYVALAERKDQRRAKLEHLYQQRAMALRMQPGGMPGGPVYPQPVYYGRGAFVYPTMMPRGRFPARGGFAGAQPPMQSYIVAPGSVPPTRGAPAGGRGGRGGAGARGALPGAAPGAAQMAVKYGPNVRNPQQPGPVAAAQQPPSDPKQVLGEKLYHQIAQQLNPQQQSLAGKITGMLLESLSLPELNGLTENTSSLNAKIAEALEVLESTADKDKK